MEHNLLGNNPNSLNSKQNSSIFSKAGASAYKLSLLQIENRFAGLNLASGNARIKLANLLLFVSIYLQKADSNNSISNANRFPQLSREQLLNALLSLNVGLTNASANELLSFGEDPFKVEGNYNFVNIHGGLTLYLTNRKSVNFTAGLPVLLSIKDFTGYSYQDKASHSGIHAYIDQLIDTIEASNVINNQASPSNNAAAYVNLNVERIFKLTYDNEALRDDSLPGYGDSSYASASKYANTGNNGDNNSSNPNYLKYASIDSNGNKSTESSKSKYHHKAKPKERGSVPPLPKKISYHIQQQAANPINNQISANTPVAPIQNQVAPINISELKILVENATGGNSTYQICEYLTIEEAKLVEQEYGVVLKKDPNNSQQFKGFLGGGSFGLVYVAKNLTPSSRDPQYCAIKIVQGNQKVVAESKHEATLQLELTRSIPQDESQLMPLIGIGREAGNQAVDNSKLYMVMPLAGMGSGEDLRKLLKNLNIGGDFAHLLMGYIAKNILLGLDQMHSNNIYHLDFKPGNLMIDQGGQIKLSDFGTSEKIGGNPPSLTTHQDPNTGRFVGNGDSTYFPPEREHRDCTFNPAHADIFAAGASVWEFLTGEQFPDSIEIYWLNDVFDNSSPNSLENLVRSLLSADPQNRLSLAQALNHPSLCIAELHDTDIVKTVLAFLKRFVKYSQLKARGDAEAEASLDSLRQSVQIVTDDAFELNPLLKTPFVNNSEVTTQLKTYQALRGSKLKQVTDPETQTFDLEQQVIEFLDSPDRIALTIFADGGSGKSLFVQHLTEKLLTSTFATDPTLGNKYLAANGKAYLPLYINLSSVKHPDRLLEEGLGLTKEAVKKLSQIYQLVIIGDGYDEQSNFTNLYLQNQLNQYDAKLIITCRPNALPGSYSEYFIPRVVGENISHSFEEFYVQSFQVSQIEAYVDGYVIRTYATKEEQEAQAKTIKEQLRGIPGLLEIMQNPLLCRLVLFALPELLQATSTKTQSGVITRAQVYAAFMQRWIELQLAKQTQASSLDLTQVLQLGQTLAFGLYTSNHAKQLDIGETIYEFDPTTHRYQKQAKSIFEQLGVSESRFETIKSILPLQESQKGVWKFTHLSMQEYLLALNLYTKLMQVSTSDSLDLLIHEWNSISLTTEIVDRPVLYFLGNMAKTNQEFAKRLFKLVFQTKVNKTQVQAASNAMTVLVASGINLAGMDFSHVEIPHADLSGGNFWWCNFTGANLSQVYCRGTNLSQVNLSDTNLTHVNFGQTAAVDMGSAINHISYSPMGNLVAISEGFRVSIYSFPEMKFVIKVNFESLVYQTSIDPQGERIAVVGPNEKVIKLYSIASGELIKTIAGLRNYGWATAIAFSPDGNSLVSGDLDRIVALCNLVSEDKKKLGEHKQNVTSILVSPDNQEVITADLVGEVKIWNIATNTCIQTIVTKHPINSLSLTTDSRYLAIAGNNGSLSLWSKDNNQYILVRNLIGHTDKVKSICFSSNSKSLASVAADGYLFIWDVETGNKLQSLTHHQGGVNAVIWNKSGRYLVSGGEDKMLRVVDLKLAPELVNRTHHQGLITGCVAINLHGKNQLISTAKDGILKITEINSGDVVSQLNLVSTIVGITINQVQAIMALVFDSEVVIYAVTIYNKLSSLNVAQVKVARFSPDGTYLALGDHKGEVSLWNTSDWSRVNSFRHNLSEIDSLGFSPNGEYLASGGSDGFIRIYALKTQKLFLSLNLHCYTINALLFEANSKYLISASNYGKIILWDLTTSQAVSCLDQLATSFNHLAISADGKYLSVASNDNYLRIYSLLTRTLVYIQEFPNPVLQISFNYSETTNKLQLAVAFNAHLSLWQLEELGGKVKLELLWLNQSPQLNMRGADISNVVGIDQANWELMEELDSYGQTPANIAATLGYSEVMRALLSNKASLVEVVVQQILINTELTTDEKLVQLSAKDSDGNPGLFIALKNGYTATVSQFVTLIVNANEKIIPNSAKLELLQTKNSVGFPGLFMALKNGYAATVSQFVTLIINADEKIIANPDKLELLQAKTSDGNPGLYHALYNGHTDAVSQYLILIINADEKIIANPDKLELVQAKDSDGFPGLYMAIQKGHVAAVSQYLTLIINANKKLIPNLDKLGLLQAKDGDGYPGLYIALKNGHATAVSQFVTLIINADENAIANPDKLELLQAKNNDGYPGLFVALKNGRTPTVVSQYVTLILNADEKVISNQAKLKLLQAKNNDGTPGLYAALRQGRATTVSQYVTLILNADEKVISNQAKLELLQAKDGDGTPGLHLALYNGHADTVSQYVTLIINADEKAIANPDKLKLLQLKSNRGFPGLYVALQNGHVATVSQYVTLILNADKTIISNQAKLELLQAKTSNGIPALISAKEKHDKFDTIKVFIQLVQDTNSLTTAEKNIILNPKKPSILKSIFKKTSK